MTGSNHRANRNDGRVPVSGQADRSRAGRSGFTTGTDRVELRAGRKTSGGRGGPQSAVQAAVSAARSAGRAGTPAKWDLRRVG